MTSRHVTSRSAVPGPVGQLITWILSPLYLVLLAANLDQATNCSMAAALVAVTLGAIALMVIIAMFCARYAESTNKNRFSIGSMMLIVTGLAIYMAYVGQVADLLPDEARMSTLFGFLSFSVLFALITTIVLIRFAHSIVVALSMLVKLANRK